MHFESTPIWNPKFGMRAPSSQVRRSSNHLKQNFLKATLRSNAEADDQSLSRGEYSVAPRDNVLFELGLFSIGLPGRERVYYLYDARQELKIPTDLLGVTPAKYELRDGRPSKRHCQSFLSIAGANDRTWCSQQVRPGQRGDGVLPAYNGALVGTPMAIRRRRYKTSLVSNYFGFRSEYIRLDGETFDKNGKLFARWRSIAVGLRSRERTLLWAVGGHASGARPGGTFAGLGHYTFDDATGIYEQADGQFADIQQGEENRSMDICPASTS